MAKNPMKSGAVVTLTAPAGGVVGGVGYVIGGIFVVAAGSAAAGESFEGHRVGQWDMAKASGVAFTEGARIFWDDTAKNFNATASGRFGVGATVKAAASGDATVAVVLDGVSVVAEA